MQSAPQPPASSGPNPFCEIGRTHPRDRHRMRPVDDQPGVWVCARHDLFAQVIPKETADGLNRGDPFPLPDGSPGVVVRPGEDRQGGVLLYYRAQVA